VMGGSLNGTGGRFSRGDGLVHSCLGGMSSRTGGFNGNGCLAIGGGLDRVIRRGSDKDEKNWGGS